MKWIPLERVKQDLPALLVDGPELRHVVVLEAHGQRDAELADLHVIGIVQSRLGFSHSHSDPYLLILHCAKIMPCNPRRQTAIFRGLALCVEL